MRLDLKLGTGYFSREGLRQPHGDRSTIALHLSLDSESQTLSLHSLLVARAESEELLGVIEERWESVIEGTRRGLDLGSILTLSARMADNAAQRRQPVLALKGYSLGAMQRHARKAGKSIMASLLSVLTVELSRGRGLDREGLAPDYEVFGYYAREFKSMTTNRWVKGQDYEQSASFRVDPAFTAKIYTVIAAAERTAYQAQDPSWDPLLLDPYDSNGSPCPLHDGAARASLFNGAPQTRPDILYTLEDARRLKARTDADADTDEKTLDRLRSALTSLHGVDYDVHREKLPDTNAAEGHMSLDEGVQEPPNIRSEFNFDNVLHGEACEVFFEAIERESF